MYDKILVPLDGSPLSECSLPHAKAIATGCRVSQVVLLTVVEKQNAVFPEYQSESTIKKVADENRKQAEETRQKAEAYIGKVADTLKKEGISVQPVVIMAETATGAVDGILDYVQDNKVDLVIMTTHGRSGISRWAFGSVADKVIRTAQVPVLTVTPGGCRTP